MLVRHVLFIRSRGVFSQVVPLTRWLFRGRNKGLLGSSGILLVLSQGNVYWVACCYVGKACFFKGHLLATLGLALDAERSYCDI